MAVRYAMTWEDSRKRWKVQHQGKRYTVSCDRLVREGLLERTAPRTKLASYRASNAWWRATLERLDKGLPAADGRTLGRHLDTWLDLQDELAAEGAISATEARNRRYYCVRLRAWLVGRDRIDEPAWAELRRHLSGLVARGTIGVESCRKIQFAAKLFVKHLDNVGVQDRPRNLDDRTLSFRVPVREIVTLTVEEVARVLEHASDQARLHYHLMLNCGFTQMDIATLTHAEVAWESGRIDRKRSKTRHHANVPTVSYPLWPETFELLKTWRSSHPELVLLTRNGTAWLRPPSRNDPIRLAWDRLKKRIGIEAPVKALRKTGATLLGSHPEHSRYDWLYLGHSPRSIKDRHYVRPDRESFDRAIRWLGHVLGVAPDDQT